MNRRDFLGTAAGLPLAVESQLQTSQKPAGTRHAQSFRSRGPVESPVEEMTAGPSRPIALCHLGFKRCAKKILVVRAVCESLPTQYHLAALDHRPVQFSRPLTRVKSDFGTFLTADFSDLDQVGLYQISVGGHMSSQGDRFGGALSAPFFIDDRVWRRTLPKAFSYIHFQRCGVEVPGCHDACHTDDGRRDDTGQHVDATGGWHDAGDFYKPVDYNGLMAVAMIQLMRSLPSSRAGDCTPEELLDEVSFGNHYFLNMQDADGKVWSGCGGNTYTDNVIGTADDRHVRTRKPEIARAVFVLLQSLIAQHDAKSDPRYARGCLGAGVRAWNTLAQPDRTLDIAFWIVAGCELYRATQDARHRNKVIALGRELLRRQNTSFMANQRLIRGFWMENGKPFVQQDPIRRTVDASMPALAAIELYETFPNADDRAKWRDAVQLYVDEYIVPLSERNAYGLIPVGLYVGSPTPETYRPVAGNLTYRYFMPVRERYWWLGTTSHLLSMALMLGGLARVSGDKGRSYVDLAYRQMEWVLGANPFGASLMMGVGLHNPMPFSMFNGLIPGGILNGIGGNMADEPVLNQTNAMDWRTCEYWSPHLAYYIWANSVLESMT